MKTKSTHEHVSQAREVRYALTIKDNNKGKDNCKDKGDKGKGETSKGST